MGKNFIITEEQYNMALKEGVRLSADVAAAGGDVKKAVSDTKKEAVKNGVKLDDATIELKASETNESMFVTKSNLEENRLKSLKKNSDLYKMKDFMKKLTGK